MKVLLFGDFSGFHVALAAGLRRLGVDAYVLSNGDGFKKISSDIMIGAGSENQFAKLLRNVNYYSEIWKHRDTDVCQVVNPHFPNLKYINRPLMWRILRSTQKKLFLSACGSDAFYWTLARKRLPYGPFEDFLKYDKKQSRHYMQERSALRHNRNVVALVDGIVPVMYEYFLGYKDSSKIRPPIPLPVELNGLDYRPNLVSGKVNVFHGVSRYGFKGTRHVEKAFEILHARYPNKFHTIIANRMPYSEYTECLRSSNIVVDQVYSQSCGINALIAMAMGKAVVSGAEPDGLKYLGQQSSPVINGLPDPEALASSIVQIANGNILAQLGQESRIHVEAHHCSEKVAERYIEEWSI